MGRNELEDGRYLDKIDLIYIVIYRKAQHDKTVYIDENSIN
jgi:hypothetical protein